MLLIFLDGVGIGPSDPRVNPFFATELPNLTAMLGGDLPTLAQPEIRGPGARSFPLDACLGTPGIPQSGTGQIALFTGLDAPALFGRHFGPWPPVRLRPRLEKENFLVRAVDGGATAAFANAYPEGYLETRDSRRVAVPPLAARAAGLLTRHAEALASDEAVASEILNDGWIEHLGLGDLPRVTAEEAGATLARIAGRHDLTVYAHYHTDQAGHRSGMEGAISALRRVDAFLGGIVERRAESALTVVVSDHGNIEDVRGGHTRNPALGLAIGRDVDTLELPSALTEVAEFVLARVGV